MGWLGNDQPDDVFLLKMLGMSLSPGDELGEQLLDGQLDPGDVPPGFTQVADLFSRLRGEIEADKPSASPELVSMLAQEVRNSALNLPNRPGGKQPKERPMLGKIISYKIGTAAAAAFLGAGSAAAATGALPAPIQATVAHIASQIGLSLPTPASNSPASPATPSGTGANGTTSTTAPTGTASSLPPASTEPVSSPTTIGTFGGATAGSAGSGQGAVGSPGETQSTEPTETESTEPTETQSTEPTETESTEPTESQSTEPSSGESSGKSKDGGDSSTSTNESSGDNSAGGTAGSTGSTSAADN
jgi:hypothetical protein